MLDEEECWAKLTFVTGLDKARNHTVDVGPPESIGDVSVRCFAPLVTSIVISLLHNLTSTLGV